MKKYISLLILAAVLSMQSCHREDIDSENMNHVQNRMERQSSKQTLDPANTMRNGTDTGFQDTGDDDEPKRDKQHWRISNDSIKKSVVKSTGRLGYGKSNDCPQHRKEMSGKW